MRIIVWLAVNALALGVAVWLFDGITLTGDSGTDRFVQLVIVGAIFGLINMIVRPVVNLLSLPLIILSLGLMLIVVNALMLLLTSKIAESTDLGFHVDGFWTAVGGAIVITLTTWVVDGLIGSERD
jgi:putative membrane protein